MTIEYFIKNWKNIKEEDITFSKDKWIEISLYEYLPEEFIEKYKYKINWHCISRYQSLSEEFIEKHNDRVDWNYISKYQKLSEEFIEKYKDKVDWYWISVKQSLSEEFIYKYKDKISHPNCLHKYYRLRYEKHSDDYSAIFSIHANNGLGLISKWDLGFDIKNIPSNIIFCKTL